MWDAKQRNKVSNWFLSHSSFSSGAENYAPHMLKAKVTTINDDKRVAVLVAICIVFLPVVDDLMLLCC